MNVIQVQSALQKAGIHAWLLTDYHQTNIPAIKLLGMDSTRHVSRRWFYLIPAQGGPVRMVHAVESGTLDHLPGEKCAYFGRDGMLSALRQHLHSGWRVAMEYSPMGRLPSVSRVDAGTLEMIRSFGIEVVSSGDLLQQFTSRWDAAALESHRYAAKVLRDTVSSVWRLVADHIRNGGISEFDVQKFMLRQFKSAGCTTDHPPIVAIDAHASDPHFSLTPENSRMIGPDQLLLIDLWCKSEQTGAVYADITWTAWTGPGSPDPHVLEVFEVVRNARNATLEAVKNAFASHCPVSGADLDRCARKVITDAGYGDHFVHRTGHSLDTDVHGAGANLDSLESEDERRIAPGTGFTIEPGIYLPGQFGIRSEINVAILQDGRVEVTGQPIQEELGRITH